MIHITVVVVPCEPVPYYPVPPDTFEPLFQKKFDKTLNRLHVSFPLLTKETPAWICHFPGNPMCVAG